MSRTHLLGLTLGVLMVGGGCKIVDPVCGNGRLERGEQCDDGNNLSGDECSATCRYEYVCGDGDLMLGEQCDDGNTTSGDGCSADCLNEVALPVCGDGIRNVGEQCDDGNNSSGDGCTYDCLVEGCGNGILEAGEECDDGNAFDYDGCSYYCQIEDTDYLTCNFLPGDCAGPDVCTQIDIEATSYGQMCTTTCSSDSQCIPGYNDFEGACYSLEGTVPLCFQVCNTGYDCFPGNVCLEVNLFQVGGVAYVDYICVPDNA